MYGSLKIFDIIEQRNSVRHCYSLDIYYHDRWKYTLWISRCIATARERILGSIANYVTGVSECSQQRGNLKDDRYIAYFTTDDIIRNK
ncbi:hypothetical protein [Photorhabdus bodei]|uniref:Uncharacterized protein n=1 Tax=Photorhabdus bodei TaxID=2029681 RepID=A0ABX0AH64_9GAMM|nr:hypothetical protein [Photorhabdus bodei]NDK98071.1 hypothetical protein [Photorhabdus bodei]NDL02321.1 hypothetical protein [Photorhabdus bodei]NDL06395.1 hypothetical protein [Photorhabdus bodei]